MGRGDSFDSPATPRPQKQLATPTARVNEGETLGKYSPTLTAARASDGEESRSQNNEHPYRDIPKKGEGALKFAPSSPPLHDWRAPHGCAVGGALIGLTAEALGRSAVTLDRWGKVRLVEQYMLAFDDVWPADLPRLRPLRLTIPRPIAAADDGQPIYLMPMHRRGRGGRGAGEASVGPPPLRRDGDETSRRRDR
eukprot:jgi/Undpi1/8414/HiC_scaffold_25.g10882.m1